MNDLLQAILDHNVNSVRKIAKDCPELLRICSQSGRLPLDLALASQDIFCAVALKRAGAPGGAENWNWREVIIDYICSISHACFCAQWHEGIENKLWQIVYEDLSDEYLLLDSETIGDIRYLVDMAKEWPIYDKDIQWIKVK